MRLSKSFIFTLREDPKVADCVSHKFLLKGCYLSMISSGIYAYLPLGKIVLEKISGIIRKNMNLSGAQEISMSALQPIEMWQKTGRDKDLAEVMFRFNDRKGRPFCLGPTHEEEVTEIVAKHVASYKQLPFILYQIQTKFRDEPRPRYGLMRSCEFIMKDAYSFDLTEQGLDDNYNKMFNAYNNIFNDCGLNVIATEADSGAMGGKVSHEFMISSNIGEDVLFYCEKCAKYSKSNKCSVCGGGVSEKRMIEIGHIFKLGLKYSLAQNAVFLDKDGARKPIIMGCYGIGVSRLLPAIAEANSDEKGIVWPKTVSPFDITFVVLDDKFLPEALDFCDVLEKNGFSVLLDDRADSAGVKFRDAYLLGNPYIVIMGKGYASSAKFDLEIRKSYQKQSLTKEELINFLKHEYGR